MRALVVASIFAAACAVPVDEDVQRTYPIDDYATWGVTAPGKRIEVRGNAPGHSNSVRYIYANAIAADPDQDFTLGYAHGAIVVKEVRELDADESLRYLAIMRRVGEVTAALEDDGGWYYTETAGPTGPEEHFDFCWSRCHVAAPYNGAFYDYRQ